MGNKQQNASQKAKIDHITEMGFDANQARRALEQTNYSIENAVQYLLQNGSNSTAQRPPRVESNQSQSERERRARAAEARFNNNPLSQLRAGNKSKPSVSNNTNRTNSNKFKIPKPKPKSIEERMSSVGEALSDFPKTFDTVLYAIDCILKNPGNKKYRELKMTNKSFMQSIGSSNGLGIEYLELVGFQQAGEWLVLRQEDSARLYIGKSILEQLKESDRYLIAKDNYLLLQSIEESKQTASQEEFERRSHYAELVPTEPPKGAAGTTIIRLFIGETWQERRFDHDETVGKLIPWFGTLATAIPKKLESGEWELVDITLNPSRVINIEEDKPKTLHGVGFWPSAELRIQVAGTEARKEAM